MAKPTWDLVNQNAELLNHPLSATMHAAQPDHGLGHLRVMNQELPDVSLLAVDILERPSPHIPSEVYVRGTDLIVKYPPREADQVSYQVYYRPIRQMRATFGVELVLSAQTSLLRSNPRVEVCSKFRSAELLVRTEKDDSFQPVISPYDPDSHTSLYFLVRPKCLPTMSNVLLVHPSDFFLASAAPQQLDRTVTFSVFPDSLEKGVIRRATFRSLFVPRHNDQAAATELFQQLNATPPLLST